MLTHSPAIIYQLTDAVLPIAPGGAPRKRRVLLAEDNQTNQLAARRMLEMLDCDIQVAANGLEAVKAFRDRAFDVVLMDNQMPEMDGFAATREIRAIERAEGKSPVPIIAVTANAMAGDREACLAAGMNDYVSKPFRVSQLKPLLDRWCGSASAHIAPEPPADDAPIDRTVLDQLRDAADDSFVLTIVRQYLVESHALATRLREAIQHRDAKDLTACAHSLRGSSSTVGAIRLAALCSELERHGKADALDAAAGLVPSLDAELTGVWQSFQTDQKAVG